MRSRRTPAFASVLCVLLIGSDCLLAAQEHPGGHDVEHGAHASSLEPHQRVGSGTSWQPDDSPLFAIHWTRGPWSITSHGVAFLVYDRQGGPRGATRGVAPNWIMNTARRSWGRGDLDLRMMNSLDPATVRPRGYPQLFQTGETFRGRPLVDAQHPHDFFMELAGIYTWRAAPRVGVQVYAAPVGEPALGPVAFPHRVSAADIPVAVLGHHLQDSTHISFGVLSAGVIVRKVKLEGSWFNGHEPDEQRWGFDPLRLNSISGRVSYAAGPHWVFQASRGRLDDPEQLGAAHDVTRTTASALYARSRSRGMIAGALIWGRNDEEDDAEDSVTLEGSVTWRERTQLFGRLERVDRTGLIDVTDPESGPPVTITALTLGAAREVFRLATFPVSAGLAATVYDKPDLLDPLYGDEPVSLYAYLRVRPPRMIMSTGREESTHGDAGRDLAMATPPPRLPLERGSRRSTARP